MYQTNLRYIVIKGLSFNTEIKNNRVSDIYVMLCRVYDQLDQLFSTR